MLYYGVELEFVLKEHWTFRSDEERLQSLQNDLEFELQRINPRLKVLLHGHPNVLQSIYSFTVGTDSSLGPRSGEIGLELRTPVLLEGNKCHADNLATVVKVLSKQKVRLTDTCGLHVHVSCPDTSRKISKPLIWRNAKRKGLKIISRSERADFTRWGNRNLDQLGHGHNAISFVPGGTSHVELRMFNASFSLRHVFRSVDLALSTVRESVVNEPYTVPYDEVKPSSNMELESAVTFLR